ncbi:hypothetical protein RRG08_065300, partial [Elysia crispata]
MIQCQHCQAMKFRDESRGMCCSNGNPEPFPPLPQQLAVLFEGTTDQSVCFLQDIRKYNSAFQLTSLGCKEVRMNVWNPQFRIQENCGVKSSNWIVGGQEASPGRWAWQVSLQEYNVTSGRWVHVCGGALVQESWVVTAGHCIHALSNADSVTAVLGSYNLSITDHGEQRIKADKLIGHPDYRHGGNYPNDVGLVHLATPVTMSRSISTVCLPQQEASVEDRSKTLHGPNARCWETGCCRTL